MIKDSEKVVLANDIPDDTPQLDRVWTVDEILEENRRRMAEMSAPFDPLTGLNSIGEREKVVIPDYPIKVQYLPIEMLEDCFVSDVIRYGVDAMAVHIATGRPLDKCDAKNFWVNPQARYTICERFNRIRYYYDFPYWCWREVKIHPKGSGDDIPFRLNRAQRRLIERLERMRKSGKPIRLVLLKARQWGGSTATQIYIAWLQLIILKGANSIIVGHVKDASAEVKDMLTKLLDSYNPELVADLDSPFTDDDQKKIARQGLYHGTSTSANLFYIPTRNAKFKIGTAEKPNSARGGDSTLAHCTEVGLWVTTDNKTPEDIVTSVTGGISYKPNTMIVYESTAKGTGNFFHKIYTAAKKAEQSGTFHQFERLFVSWYEIGWKNMMPFKDNKEYLKSAVLSKLCENGKSITPEYAQKNVPWFDFYLPDFISEDAPTEQEFAEKLLAMKDQKDAPDDCHEPGEYLWYLWQSGATLQGIYWYECERTKYHNHADMASETPSNDIEAFKHSGSKVFSEYNVEKFAAACRPPKYIGDVVSTSAEAMRNGFRPGKSILKELVFRDDPTSSLWIWRLPDSVTHAHDGFKMRDQYLVVVDIGGVSNKSDWSVICVFDRAWLADGGKPEVVAQWYGHIHHDLLAWKAAQIAKYYDNALLVIESNTLETRDRDRDVDGDVSDFILNQIKECYDNLYERHPDNEKIIDGAPQRFGFHTNTKTKVTIIKQLQHIIREQLYVERDERVLHEYNVYEKRANGSFGAIKGEHDDLLMTRAIGLYVCYCEMDMPKFYEVNNYSPREIAMPDTVSAAVF